MSTKMISEYLTIVDKCEEKISNQIKGCVFDLKIKYKHCNLIFNGKEIIFEDVTGDIFPRINHNHKHNREVYSISVVIKYKKNYSDYIFSYGFLSFSLKYTNDGKSVFFSDYLHRECTWTLIRNIDSDNSFWEKTEAPDEEENNKNNCCAII